VTLDHRTIIEALGWAATATFIASYFFTRAETLVRVQMFGGVMWVAYGALVHATPVVAANLLVILAAAWKTWRSTRTSRAEGRRRLVDEPLPPGRQP
jgi:hypothetical protein